MLLAAVTVAIVVQGTPMRAAPRETSPRQASLASGDWLEVRGERQGYLQVYDHRRERPGYVRPSQVRTYPVDEAAAPRLGAVVEYLRDAPGEESLGIGYAALFMRAAPAKMIGVDVLDALGTMADRLARRASATTSKGNDAALAAQMEVAESYGVRFARFDHEGRTRVCYDGEAFRRVLALGGTGAQRVRAAMGLTDPACADPAVGQSAALALATWRAGVLDAVDPAALGPDVLAFERARLRIRRAAVGAELAFYAERGGDHALARKASEGARKDLALVDRPTMADEDKLTYDEAALRVATVRWAAEPAPDLAARALAVDVSAGQPGQTCVRLTRRGAAANAKPLVEHCTYAVVWPSSVRVAPRDAAVTLVAQPLVGWSELVVMRPGAEGWTAETMTPGSFDPELGYVEPAGFSPDGSRLLVVREARASGPLGSPNTLAPWIERSFQVVATDGMRVEHRAAHAASLDGFRRWQSVDWRRGTLALR